MKAISIMSFSSMLRGLAILAVVTGLAASLSGQVTSGEILGLVRDPSGAGVTDAKITLRNLETNATGEAMSGPDGSFRFPQLPIGPYESTVEKPGFAPHVRGPIVLRLNQIARLDIQLELATITERVTVTSDAPLLNANNAEMGVNFERRRISELPLAPNRNVLNLALSAPGVNQLQGGQNPQLSGSLPFSVNGMRTRSNDFMIDGQNSSSSVLTGLSQPLNNPDIVAEFRLITNQFAPEYGRASGSIVNIVTKNGTNQLHGSAFWFHNDHHLNAPTNLDQEVAPFRIENQFGGTLGGPIVKNKTFFFGSLQRWTDRLRGVGRSFIGAPTVEGRSLLESMAGTRPTVKILLEHVPPAQLPVPGKFAPVTVEGRTENIPLGSLRGSSNLRADDWQWSARVDHRFSEKLTLGGRYLANDRFTTGIGQVVPPGLTGDQLQHPQAASIFVNHALAPSVFHELRLSYQRSSGGQVASDPASERIPAIEITDLAMTQNASGIQRTAIGLPTDLPRSAVANRYQLQSTFGVQRGTHSMKFGIDFQRDEVNQLLQTTVRGSLVYPSLQDLVDDVASSGRINSSLPGGSQKTYNKQYDYAFFVQDEWRIRPNLSLTYGIRYESPGNLLTSLGKAADRIMAANGGDPRFVLSPVAPRDTNNWAPRFGFNYRFPDASGLFHFLTGNQALVVRGGYARTYDSSFTQVATQVANSFPFVKSDSFTRVPNSLEALLRLPSAPLAGDLNVLTRDLPPGDLRSPYADQFALQLQREIGKDWLFSLGYVGTKGTALFQQIDVNPTIPGTRGQRVDSSAGVRRMRCNCTSSIYHSLQTSLEKRLSRDFSMAAHYTWSAFIDGASDLVSPSPSGESQVAQDSYNRRADRARASFDHPHRVAVNGVFELPFMREKKGLAGKVLGGWQASGFLTLQSGTPFTALDGADPGFRLSQLNAMPRVHLNTGLDLASLSVQEIYRAGGATLFSRVTASNPLGNIGRNILRSDGIGNLDLGLIKNTRIAEGQNLQFRAEFYNASNTRNFGIPQGIVSSSDFLNQWGTDGGNRRIVLALRYTF